MARNPLRNLDVATFMRRHWQREPLLIRGAIPAFRDPLAPREVLSLATREDAVSRLVERRGRRWTLEHGPFAARRLARMPPRDWTVLVQNTNHFSAEADRLLARFDFVPHARIDDVMVSYASPGGGVGPHVDSYDVFLLQGHGRRRWRISRQDDLAFVPGMDLKILRRFRPEREWVLEPGDMLYLPPNVAHDGVALEECLTWSVGFRAPSDAELARGFLDFLHDRVAPEGQYADPGARAVAHPGRIPPAMIAHATRVARGLAGHAVAMREHFGEALTEPKAHVVFDPPGRVPPPATFARRGEREGYALDRRSRLLFSGTMFFINGERAEVPAAARPWVRRLADRRRLDPGAGAPRAFWDLAREWTRCGFAVLGGDET